MSYWLVLFGDVAGIDSVISFAAAVGGVILAPIFYIGMGLTLGNQQRARTQTVEGTMTKMGFDRGSL